MSSGTTIAGEGRYLMVRSGAERFAIPAGSVVGVVQDLAVHPVPGGRPPLLGLGQHAGDPIVVVDLLELATGAVGGQRIIVVVTSRDAGGRADTIGLAVDDAERLVTLTDETPAAGEKGVRALARVGDLAVRVVAPEAIAEPQPPAGSTGNQGPQSGWRSEHEES